MVKCWLILRVFKYNVKVFGVWSNFVWILFRLVSVIERLLRFLMFFWFVLRMFWWSLSDLCSCINVFFKLFVWISRFFKFFCVRESWFFDIRFVLGFIVIFLVKKSDLWYVCLVFFKFFIFINILLCVFYVDVV